MDKQIALRQLQVAEQNGWMPSFREVAQRYGFPVELLLAIASRETSMQDIRGDYHHGLYHGFGIMQIDVGTDPKFCQTWKPGMVHTSIERATQILREKQAWLKNVQVEDLKAIAAAYNTGQGNVYKSIRAGLDPDTTTMGRNYGSDVIARMALFAECLGQEHAAA